jgi:hypothetical protein
MANSYSDAGRKGAADLLPRLYEAVGWGEGRSPDWDGFRACCHPQCLLVPMGTGTPAPLAVEKFIEGMEAQRTSGALASLREWEIGNAVVGYGDLATVRSTFVAEIAGVERRGVTFATLARDGDAWLILSASWENERDEEPLP